MADPIKLRAYAETRLPPEKLDVILAAALETKRAWSYVQHAICNHQRDRYRKAVREKRRKHAARKVATNTRRAAAVEYRARVELAVVINGLVATSTTPGQVCGLGILHGILVYGCSQEELFAGYPGVSWNNLCQRKHRALVRVRALASEELRGWIEWKLPCWKGRSA